MQSVVDEVVKHGQSVNTVPRKDDFLAGIIKILHPAASSSLA
jgi:hypothetical protein